MLDSSFENIHFEVIEFNSGQKFAQSKLEINDSHLNYEDLM